MAANGVFFFTATAWGPYHRPRLDPPDSAARPPATRIDAHTRRPPMVLHRLAHAVAGLLLLGLLLPTPALAAPASPVAPELEAWQPATPRVTPSHSHPGPERHRPGTRSDSSPRARPSRPRAPRPARPPRPPPAPTPAPAPAPATPAPGRPCRFGLCARKPGEPLIPPIATDLGPGVLSVEFLRRFWLRLRPAGRTALRSSPRKTVRARAAATTRATRCM